MCLTCMLRLRTMNGTTLNEAEQILQKEANVSGA
jgi:hypothetical protein